MLDPSKMTDEEQLLVAEIAKAKNMTIEEVLVDLGHELPGQVDAEPVSLEGPPAAEDPPPIEAPIEVDPAEPAVALETPQFEPAIEPPPPPMAEEEPLPDSGEEAAESDEGPPATIDSVCTHCGWDQTQPVIEEPSNSDKLSFLQAILGAVPFSKRFELFGGNLRVTFRTLTVKEIDALYEATYAAQKEGLIQTTSDYYEYLNRLRLHLQVVAVTGKKSTLHHKLPDGLDETTNGAAKNTWESFLKKKKLFKEDVLLPVQIQEYILSYVLMTEQLLRVVTFECSKFNRLAAKLEARVDDSDFWKGTSQPS